MTTKEALALWRQIVRYAERIEAQDKDRLLVVNLASMIKQLEAGISIKKTLRTLDFCEFNHVIDAAAPRLLPTLEDLRGHLKTADDGAKMLAGRLHAALTEADDLRARLQVATTKQNLLQTAVVARMPKAGEEIEVRPYFLNGKRRWVRATMDWVEDAYGVALGPQLPEGHYGVALEGEGREWRRIRAKAVSK